MGKLTNEEVIERCKKVHGDKYNYSKLNYVDSKTKLCIICPEHGEFHQLLSNHLKGCGCSACSNNKRMTTEEYVSTLKKRFPDSNAIYDKVVYVNNHTPIKLICPIHGEWEVLPMSILKRCECPKCQKERLHNEMSKTMEQFIKEAREVHGDKYDYSKVEYKGCKTNICIICPKHGEFWQSPNTHLRGSGCPKCGDISMWDKRGRMDTETIKKKFIKKHGDKYDYSKVRYVNRNTKVCIICPEHGEFLQSPYAHLNGEGCPHCGKITLAKYFAKTTEQFIKEARDVHGDRYDYSKVNYVNCHTKVEIICKKHGSFWQNPMSHLKGFNCPMCYAESSVSNKEIGLNNYLKGLCFGNNIRFNDRTIIPPLELDFANEDMKIAVEYNGLYWHSDEKQKDTQYHLNKTNKCKEKGYQLIHIFEDEWDEKPEIVKSRLENIFGKTPNKIPGRKCVIKEVCGNETKMFLEKNHIQGNVNSSIRYGLYYNEELVSIMTFTKLRKNLGSVSEEGTYELVRFCNKTHHEVIGGASKLLKHFIKNKNPKKIISYADKRWSKGNMYFKLGFNHIRDSKPSYFYTLHGKNRENRFKYRKDILVRDGFDKEKSESQIMMERGYNRIYDCGCMVFEMIL